MSSALIPFMAHAAPAHGAGSAIRRMYEQTMRKAAGAKAHVLAGAAAVRQGGESALTGVAIAALEGYVTPKLPASLQKVHPSAALAVVGLGASVALPAEELSHDARNIGSAALAVFATDQMRAFLKSKGAPGIHGDYPSPDTNYPSVGEDPIVAKARSLAG